LAEFRGISKFYIKSEISFLGKNQENDNKGDFLDSLFKIREFTLTYHFDDFHSKMTISG